MGRAKNANVVFVLIVLVLSTMGIGLVTPVLPFLIESFCDGNVAEASRYVGIFGAAYAAMQFLFAPIVGALSDRFGRRVVLLVSLLGASLDYCLLALAPTLEWFFLGRIVAGVTGASFSAAMAYIADVTPPEERAKKFGLAGAALGAGFVLGPALGGLLAGVHLRAPFIVAAGLSALNLAYGFFVLPESLAPEHRREFDIRRANPLGSLRRLAESPVLVGFAATLLFALIAQFGVQSVWALYTEQCFGWLPLQVGISLAVVGVTTGIAQGWLVGLTTRWIGEHQSVLLGLLFCVVSFVGIGVATEEWMLYAFVMLFALSGIVGPSIQSLLSREVGPSEQGELQGSITSLQSVALMLGPLSGTYLFAHYAPVDAVPHAPAVPFYAAALLDVLAIVIALRLFAQVRARKAPVGHG
ncbi:MAG: TCR/Tet family MFS transporter [Myxococcales bacterium]|nr:TCR/Tet family MFS transporter [Myxococcales bacterium]